MSGGNDEAALDRTGHDRGMCTRARDERQCRREHTRHEDAGGIERAAGALSTFLERGGWVAWGAVPTDGAAGAPGGDKDEECAKAGLDAIRDKIDF